MEPREFRQTRNGCRPILTVVLFKINPDTCRTCSNVNIIYTIDQSFPLIPGPAVETDHDYWSNAGFLPFFRIARSTTDIRLLW